MNPFAVWIEIYRLMLLVAEAARRRFYASIHRWKGRRLRESGERARRWRSCRRVRLLWRRLAGCAGAARPGSYPRRGAHDGQGRRLHRPISALVARAGGPYPARVRIAAGALRAVIRDRSLDPARVGWRGRRREPLAGAAPFRRTDVERRTQGPPRMEACGLGVLRPARAHGGARRDPHELGC